MNLLPVYKLLSDTWTYQLFEREKGFEINDKNRVKKEEKLEEGAEKSGQ